MALTFRQVRNFSPRPRKDRFRPRVPALTDAIGRHLVNQGPLEAERTKNCSTASNGVTLTFRRQQFLQRAHTIAPAFRDAMRGPHRGGTKVAGTCRRGRQYTVAGYLLQRCCRGSGAPSLDHWRRHEFARDAHRAQLVRGRVDGRSP